MTNDELSNEAREAIMQCQHRFWQALEHKDAELFMQVLAEDFVCRSIDQDDQGRTQFILTLTSLPLTIVNIDGEVIKIRLVGDVAILTGVQLAEMRLPNGETVVERLALTNIFQHRMDRWQMILAHPVLL